MKNLTELNFEDLDKIVGGTKAEAKDFLYHLFEKYGTEDITVLKGLVSQEEKNYYTYAMNHKKGEPLKPYPD